MEYLVYNLTREEEIARVKVAGSFFSRAIGLMFRRSLGEMEGLLIEFADWMEKPSLHSLFMFFPIELIFIDESLKVVEVARLKPWRIYRPHKRARYVLEVLEGKDIGVGDRLEFKE